MSTATGAVLANYTVSYIAGEFTITPKAATVTAGNGTKEYGSADPALTAVTTTGFSAGDLAGLTLGIGSTAHCRFGSSMGSLRSAQDFQRRIGFLIQLGEAVLLGEPHGRSRRRLGAGGQPVPAPDRALAADQNLAGPQMRLQKRSIGLVNQPGLGQPAGQLRRRANVDG